MASAQVLPTSRKQEHLEAGKRKLEEFRKKKAAERAKKSAPTSQPYTSYVGTVQQQVLDTERATYSDGADASARSDSVVEGSSVDMDNENRATALSQKYEQGYPRDTNSNNLDFKKDDHSDSTETIGVNSIEEGNNMPNDFSYYSATKGPVSFEILNAYSQSNGTESFPPKENKKHPKDTNFTVAGSLYSNATANASSANSDGFQMHAEHSVTGLPAVGSTTSSYYQDPIQHTTSDGVSNDVKGMDNGQNLDSYMISDLEERKRSSYSSGLPTHHAASQTSDSKSVDSDFRSSQYRMPQSSTDVFRKSRPSFLDSLNVPRASTGTFFPQEESNTNSFMSRTSNSGVEAVGSSGNNMPSKENETLRLFSKPNYANRPSAFNSLINLSSSTVNGVDALKASVNESKLETNHDFYAPIQDGDFGALEQHIEDLTQEKFSLQRALEAAQALAESLASENSSLTDTYNQQRSVVNQLKFDMQMLQDEIKAQLAQLESVKMECTNAHLECNAADERAKLLASEVIGLEEKSLKLRSSVLKLERQLENAEAELSSYKKKMSSLDKERQDLQGMVDALQEEKKLLQSKLRKASGGRTVGDHKGATLRKDMFTSTEDLETSDQETHFPSNDETQATHISPFYRDGLSTNEATGIPPDQMRMIQNINALISELALEKEELTQALASESSQSSKLKDLNKELSKKLEAQTQRLELLTAKSMASGNIPARLPDSQTMHDNTTTYADEGDEVVERVLGWIMKLFPGGSSRRKPSKLL